MKQENACEGMSHHTGIALATENILQFAGLSPSSAAMSNATLDKRPSCVNQNYSQLPSGLTLRNRYLGEVRQHLVLDICWLLCLCSSPLLSSLLQIYQ